MKFRIFGVVAIAAFALVGVLGSAPGLAQNAYITNSGANTVSVVNTATNTVIATVPVGSGPSGVAVSPDGTTAYVASGDGNTVSVINTAMNAVIATITVGSGPFGLAVTPDGSRVYVADSGDSSVSVVNTATNTVIATIPVGSGPGWRGGDPGRQQGLRREQQRLQHVSVIATATNTVIGPRSRSVSMPTAWW